MNTLFGALQSGDISNCLMGLLSGNQTGSCSWIPTGVQVVAPALVSVLKYISWAATVVAAFLFSTWVVQKILLTSHTGGQAVEHWDMVFMPIRLLIAAGLLIPYPNGLSGVQDLTLYLAKSGIVIADKAWDRASSIIDDGSYKIVPSIPPDVDKLTTSILKSMVCMDIENIDAPGNVVMTEQVIGGSGGSAPQYDVISFEAGPNAFGIAGNPCGTYSLPLGSSTVIQSSTNPFSSLDSQNVSRITNTQSSALSQMIQSLSPIANAIAQNITNPQGTPGSGARAKCFENQDMKCLTQPTQLPGMSPADQNPAGKGKFLGSISTIEYTYEQQVLEAAQSYGNVGRYTNPGAGWFLAGDAFRNLMLHTKALVNAVDSTPSPAIGIDLSQDGKSVEEGVKEVDFYVKNYGTSQTQNLSQTVDNACSATSSVSSSGKIACKILSLLGVNKYAGNPILATTQIGIGLEDIGIGIASGGGLLGIVDSSLGTAGLTIGEAIFIPGVLLAEWLPVVPSITWLFFVVGWFALVVEAIVAGPLFAVAHLDPGGPGLAGGMAITGYRLLMGVVFRPILGIAGLLAGMLLSKLAVYLALSLWYSTASVGAHGGTIHDAISQVSLAVFFAIAITFVIFKSMELITYVPERVMRWLGGPVDSMSEHGMVGKVGQFWGEKMKEFGSGFKKTVEGYGGKKGKNEWGGGGKK